MAQMDPRIVIPLASATTWYIYKRYEPPGTRTASLFFILLPLLLTALLRPSFPSTPTALIIVSLRYYTLTALFTLTYRLSPLHPLARYPGPLLCRVSKGWLAFVAARTGKAHLYIKELHEKYGEVVRIGPNELSMSRPDVTTAVLSAKGLPRGPYYDTREHKAGVSLDGLRDTALHAVRRRPWSRGMNSAAMKHYETLIQATVHRLVEALHQREGEKVDISRWMTFFGFDFMGQMCFSEDFGMIKNGRDTHGLIHLIDSAMFDSVWISHIPWAVPFLQYIPGASRSWDRIKLVGEATAKRRAERGSAHPDLFHYLMDEDGNEEVKPTIDIVALDGQLAIIAGSDTAATTLAHIWYFLLSNPKCYERLRKEVDAEFPRGEDTAADLFRQTGMPYLNAIINECMRLYPPVLTGLQRRVVPGSGGKMIGPHFIPEDTQVSLSAYSIHRDPAHFSPLPDTFWPDRWLVQDSYTLPGGEILPQDGVLTNRDVFMPFSQGPMVCAGKNVALAEVRALTCAIVQQFEVGWVDGEAVERWEGCVQDIFTTRRGRLPVVLRSRAA